MPRILTQWGNIFAENGNAAQCQCRGGCGFAEAAFTRKSDSAALKFNGAGVHGSDVPAPQNESQHRAQKVGRKIRVG